MVFIDRITAVMISGLILLMGFSVQQRAHQSSVEGTMLYVGKKKTLALADLLERDLANVGFGTAPGQDAITTFSTRGDDILDMLEFWGSNTTGGQVAVRYEMVAADTTTFDGQEVPLFELRRYENQGGAWVRAGGSDKTIVRLMVALLDDNNNVVARENARRIRVNLVNAVLPKIDTEAYLQGFRRLRWGMTLSPSNIRGYQGG